MTFAHYIVSEDPNVFVDETKGIGHCMRCARDVPTDSGDVWGCLAQVRKREKRKTPVLTGGLLCGECGVSFRTWVGARNAP